MKRLPDTELVVMQAIWSCEPPVSRAEMQEILKQTHPMAQTTLLTLLTRLSEKGFIKIEKHGRISKYIPLISEREYLANQGKRFIISFVMEIFPHLQLHYVTVVLQRRI